MITHLSGAIPKAQGVVEAQHQTGVNLAFPVPSIVQELSQDDVLLDCCSQNLQLYLCACGDLPPAVSNKVACFAAVGMPIWGV